jgi:hypothetical protein
MAKAITKEDLQGALKDLRRDISLELQEFREEVRVDFKDIRVELRDFRTSVDDRFNTVESANLELLQDMKNLVTELKTHHIPSLNDGRIFDQAA